jgi:hypothetical protein
MMSEGIKWLPGRGKSEREARVNGIRFYLWHADDAGFGLTAYREYDHKRLHGCPGILWLRTKRNCVERAEHILAQESELAG